MTPPAKPSHRERRDRAWQIRVWAYENGIHIPRMGRIPAAVARLWERRVAEQEQEAS